MGGGVNKILRIGRIALSVIALTAITCALVGLPLALLPQIGEWLGGLQLVYAAIVFALYVFVGWLIVTLLFGRVYCSSVCPLGTVMDMAARRGRRRMRADYRYCRPNNQLRYMVLVATVVCLMGGYVVAATLLDPYAIWCRVTADLLAPLCRLVGINSTAPIEGGAWWNDNTARIGAVSLGGVLVAMLLLAIVVVASWRKGRILCNTICPVGTTLGFISRFAIFQIEIDTDKCIQCRKCEYVCKAQCLDLIDHVTDGSRCINCFNCINVCPNDAIHYTPRRKQLSIPMMQRITGLARTPEPNSTIEAANKAEPQSLTNNTSKKCNNTYNCSKP